MTRHNTKKSPGEVVVSSVTNGKAKLPPNLEPWSPLLFRGRNKILRLLPFGTLDTPTILEVGCAQCRNLRRLSWLYPNATLIGVDLPERMPSKLPAGMDSDSATIKSFPYGVETWRSRPNFDAILFSYTLSMSSPAWEILLQQAVNDLDDQGVIAVVDFYRFRNLPLLRQMRNSGVRADREIPDWLHSYFSPTYFEISSGPFGLWEYFLFIGQKKTPFLQ